MNEWSEFSQNLSGVNLAAGSSGKWGESSGRKKLVFFLLFCFFVCPINQDSSIRAMKKVWSKEINWRMSICIMQFNSMQIAACSLCLAKGREERGGVMWGWVGRGVGGEGA